MSDIPMAHVCEWCKREFFHVRAEQRFCNTRCSNKKSATDRSRASRRSYICKRCGAAFEDKKTAEREFCSQNCYWLDKKMSPQLFPAHFWARVNKDGPIPNHVPHLGPCWIWTGGSGTDGYGAVTTPSGKTSAHRAAFALSFGEIRSGLMVCHHCDNGTGGCVRPDHLFLGTALDNARDMVSKGRSLRGARSNLYGKSKRGEQSSSALLTEAQVIEIRARLAAGETQLAISADYPVSESCIGVIARRRTWRRVP